MMNTEVGSESSLLAITSSSPPPGRAGVEDGPVSSPHLHFTDTLSWGSCWETIRRIHSVEFNQDCQKCYRVEEISFSYPHRGEFSWRGTEQSHSEQVLWSCRKLLLIANTDSYICSELAEPPTRFNAEYTVPAKSCWCGCVAKDVTVSLLSLELHALHRNCRSFSFIQNMQP